MLALLLTVLGIVRAQLLPGKVVGVEEALVVLLDHVAWQGARGQATDLGLVDQRAAFERVGAGASTVQQPAAPAAPTELAPPRC